MSGLAAVLAALSVLVLTHAPTPRERLRRLSPLPPRQADRRSRSALLGPVGALGGGLAGWLVLGPAVGAVLGLVLLVALPKLAEGSADSDEDRRHDREVVRELPLALDLLAACLAGGAPPHAALAAVADALEGPCGQRLAAVAARLAVGTPAAEAWTALGADRGPAGAAARAMARAAVGGAPVAAAVHRVAAQARQEAAARAERAARRAGVLAVGPLGLCFLPAFLLLGVVPAVIGLALPVLGSL